MYISLLSSENIAFAVLLKLQAITLQGRRKWAVSFCSATSTQVPSSDDHQDVPVLGSVESLFETCIPTITISQAGVRSSAFSCLSYSLSSLSD